MSVFISFLGRNFIINIWLNKQNKLIPGNISCFKYELNGLGGLSLLYFDVLITKLSKEAKYFVIILNLFGNEIQRVLCKKLYVNFIRARNFWKNMGSKTTYCILDMYWSY